MSASIRSATESDVDSLLEIYRPFVEEDCASFEERLPDRVEFRRRVRDSLDGWDWLVAEDVRGILGYAYGTSHRARTAYRFSAEVSVYLAPEARRQGLGSRLYCELLERLGDKGYHNAYAGIALPNPASVAFHESMGFLRIGVFPRIGYKFNTWIDVVWYHRPLVGGGESIPPS